MPAIAEDRLGKAAALTVAQCWDIARSHGWGIGEQPHRPGGQPQWFVFRLTDWTVVNQGRSIPDAIGNAVQREYVVRTRIPQELAMKLKQRGKAPQGEMPHAAR